MAKLVVDTSRGYTRREIRNTAHREIVCRSSNGDILMRILPSSIMQNSKLIQECIEKQRVFVVNLKTGVFYFVEGDIAVEPVNYDLISIEE